MQAEQRKMLPLPTGKFFFTIAMHLSRIHRTRAIQLITAVALLATTSATQAASRHALIIGNSNYQASPLDNPVNDARDMATVLAELNFHVYGQRAHTDLTFEEMEVLINDFSNSLPDSAVAVFYFAGHGTIDENRHNYLIPLGASIERENQIKHRAMSLRYVADTLADGNQQGLNILLIDACRDRPFGRSLLRSGTRGMARPSHMPVGTFIGMAAGEGQVAADGYGQTNGLYTGQLIKALRTHAHLPIEQFHKRVGQAVYQQTSWSPEPQRPMYQSNFYGDWCFGRCNSIAEPLPGAARPSTPISHFSPEIRPKSDREWLEKSTAPLATDKSEFADKAPLAENGKSDYLAAYNLVIKGRNYEAIRRLEAFISEFPDSIYLDRAHYWLGEANYVARQFEAAIEHFDDVIIRFPGSQKTPSARLRKSFALFQLQRFGEARRELEMVEHVYRDRAIGVLARKRINQMDRAGL